MTPLALLLLLLASSVGRNAVVALNVGESAGVRSSGAAAAGSLADGSSSHAQAANNKFLPEGISKADKLRAFLECRKECIAKCDRLVYVYSTKKEFCHDCIRQCMVAVLQQARSLGIDFSTQEERMLGDSPADGGPESPEARRRRRRRNRLRSAEGPDRRGRRERRQRKQLQEQQRLLKNCIVH